LALAALKENEVEALRGGEPRRTMVEAARVELAS
jgi:hypothetical protein